MTSFVLSVWFNGSFECHLQIYLFEYNFVNLEQLGIKCKFMVGFISLTVGTLLDLLL